MSGESIYVKTKICDLCSRAANGPWPTGWLILPVWEQHEDRSVSIVAERSFCAACRPGIKHVHYRTPRRDEVN